MLSRQPSFPCRFNRSVRKYEDSTALQQKHHSENVTLRQETSHPHTWTLSRTRQLLSLYRKCLRGIDYYAQSASCSADRLCVCVLTDPYLTSTLSAPRGVTKVAGANAYAAKLAASPAPTRKDEKQSSNAVENKMLPQSPMRPTRPVV